MEFDVYTDGGEYYSTVQIPNVAMLGDKPPRQISVDGVICEINGEGKYYVRKDEE